MMFKIKGKNKIKEYSGNKSGNQKGMKDVYLRQR